MQSGKCLFKVAHFSFSFQTVWKEKVNFCKNEVLARSFCPDSRCFAQQKVESKNFNKHINPEYESYNIW